MFKDTAIIFYVVRRSFLTKSQQQQCLLRFESILDGQFSRHLLPATFRLEIVNICCVWSRNLVNEEAVADVGPQRHVKIYIYIEIFAHFWENYTKHIN
jgi:hypothetical protein